MERLNPFWFYHIGVYLGVFRKLPHGVTVGDASGAADYARIALRTIADGKGPVPLPKCENLAKGVLSDIELVFGQPKDTVIKDGLLDLIAKKLIHLESTMAADVRDLNVFHVLPVGIFDTTALLERAEGNLSKAAQDALAATTKQDLREAGACLAFHQFTAAGFHSLRATEAEAQRYYTEITGKPAGPELSFGKVASHLVDQYTSKEVEWVKAGRVGSRAHNLLGVISQLLVRINDIFRNPIMHPEMTLDQERAIEVFGLASRVISAIAEDLSARRGTP